MKKNTVKVLASMGAMALTGAAAAAVNSLDRVYSLLFKREDETVKKEFQKGDANSSQSKQQMYKQLCKEWLSHVPALYYHLENEDGNDLEAKLYKSENPSKRFVIGLHGYRSDGTSEFAAMMPFYLSNGFNVLLPDHQSHGGSEGEFITFGDQESRDALLWIRFLIEQYGKDIEIAIHGVSMGAATALQLAGFENLPKNVKFIVEDCGYSSAKAEIMEAMKSAKMNRLLYYPIEKYFKLRTKKNLKNVNGILAVEKSRTPILFIHGLSDKLIPYTMSEDLYDHCISDKELFLVRNADHAQSWFKDSVGYKKHILEFARKYMTV